MRTFANPSQIEGDSRILSPLPTTSRTFSISDTEFSTLPSQGTNAPYSASLSVMRALDYESEALLEAVSVNKILDRANIVILIRDYSVEKSTLSDFSHALGSSEALKQATKQDLERKPIGDYALAKARAAYEEYEQVSSSPWAQSLLHPLQFRQTPRTIRSLQSLMLTMTPLTQRRMNPKITQTGVALKPLGLIVRAP